MYVVTNALMLWIHASCIMFLFEKFSRQVQTLIRVILQFFIFLGHFQFFRAKIYFVETFRGTITSFKYFTCLVAIFRFSQNFYSTSDIYRGSETSPTFIRFLLTIEMVIYLWFRNHFYPSQGLFSYAYIHIHSNLFVLY